MYIRGGTPSTAKNGLNMMLREVNFHTFFRTIFAHLVLNILNILWIFIFFLKIGKQVNVVP